MEGGCRRVTIYMTITSEEEKRRHKTELCEDIRGQNFLE